MVGAAWLARLRSARLGLSTLDYGVAWLAGLGADRSAWCGLRVVRSGPAGLAWREQVGSIGSGDAWLPSFGMAARGNGELRLGGMAGTLWRGAVRLGM